jgi:hypothetical protein
MCILNHLQVHDSDLRVEELGVDALPAIVGWLPNGEKIILKTGVSVKDVKSGVKDLSNILDSFEKVSKKETSSQAKKAQADSEDGHIQLLSPSNFEALCGEKTPVCIIGAFRSSKSREKLESFLSLVIKNLINLMLYKVYNIHKFYLVQNLKGCTVISGLTDVLVKKTKWKRQL